MAADEVHKNDIGTIFKVTVKDGNDVVDLSATSTKQIIFKKPSGSLLTTNASFFTDGTDGILTYTTVSGDLDEIGTWKLQGYVVIGTSEFRSDIKSFKVYRNL